MVRVRARLAANLSRERGHDNPKISRGCARRVAQNGTPWLLPSGVKGTACASFLNPTKLGVSSQWHIVAKCATPTRHTQNFDLIRSNQRIAD